MKETPAQKVTTRKPRQERARHKVQLILEAAMRLMDENGMALLNTNAVAQRAGVSIGTLYQYFPNKDAILDALAEQEMAELSARVLAALQDDTAACAQQRISRIVSAVATSYGERRRVHRLVLEHSLTHAAPGEGGQRVGRLIETVIALLTTRTLPATGHPLDQADAFVLANAFLGVMRAMVSRPDASQPTQAAIEQALGRLIIGFIGGPAS
jgi:AcrR family transcriptional regulator